MARRYTIADVVTQGSSVAAFRTAITNRQMSSDRANLGFSEDARMRNMFPKSPLYEGLGSEVDKEIISRFRVGGQEASDPSGIDTKLVVTSSDFQGTRDIDKAYMNFNHPNSPDLEMNKLNDPISDNDINGGELANKDRPYYGHPNLQVNSVDPFDQRDNPRNANNLPTYLLRERTAEDGGFGTKYDTNYKTTYSSEVIGSYFSRIYPGNTDVDNQQLSKQNLLGTSNAKYASSTQPASNANARLN